MGSSGNYLGSIGMFFWGTFYSWALCVCDKYIHNFIKVATFISQARILLWTSYTAATVSVVQPQLQNAHQTTLLLENLKPQRRYPRIWTCLARDGYVVL